MITVIQKEDEHRRRVKCPDCDSILEYDYKDTEHTWHCDYVLKLDIHKLYISCPVCKSRLKVREWATDCL